ncbi:MAG: DNA ligase D [Burkholderiales bacterium]|nr:DNA ligase D [Burkholderiales bacterium]
MTAKLAAAPADALARYRAKRNFTRTPEPAEGGAPGAGTLSFVVQKHWASSLHYDFRLELGGAMKSWAVPKGPSFDPCDKRMAMHVEDHPLAYAAFEGTIPPKQYGAGKVIVWDKGHWLPVGDPQQGYHDGNLKFELQGHKLQGRWVLVRMKGQGGKQEPWLLIKEKDNFARPAADFSVVDEQPDSVGALPLVPPPAVTALPVRKEAPKADLPASLAPQLATLVATPPEAGSDWFYEIKFDGYRMLARIEGRTIRLFTRNGNDWTAKLAPLRAALLKMKLPNGWYDGEVVVMNSAGVPDFGALQRAFDASTPADIVYYLFDLPYCDGRDLRRWPLEARRETLRRLLEAAGGDTVRFSEVFEASAQSVLASACRLGLEGVIAKRRDAVYVSRRSADWLKIKCVQRQEFVVGGFTDPQGARSGLGALLLGVHDEHGVLQYAGRVGTGFDDSTLASLTKRLATLRSDERPFDAANRIEGRPHWVAPRLVAEVSFAEWTRDHHIRHAVFRGLREDKAAAPRDAASVLAGVRVTHPDRVIDPGIGVTKIELLRYYGLVGSLMMLHLKGRPVSLVRAPEGVGGPLFFQKHAEAQVLPGIRQLDPALYISHPPMLEVATARGLLSATQWNVIEFHTLNTGTRSFEHPDRMVFDLDPGEGVAWSEVQEAAELVHAFLGQLGLMSFLKTSGGKGLHVVVPLRKVHDWDTVKGFSQAVVTHMAQILPKRFVAKSGPRNRVGRIFIDYLRNGLGASTVCAWSARARPGLGVSVPLDWRELAALRSADQWTIRNVHERLDVGNTPWSGYAKAAKSLNAAMKALGWRPAAD